MYACNISRSLAKESRFIGSGTVEGIGAALGAGMGLMWGISMGLQGNIVEVEVRRTVIGRVL